ILVLCNSSSFSGYVRGKASFVMAAMIFQNLFRGCAKYSPAFSDWSPGRLPRIRISVSASEMGGKDVLEKGSSSDIFDVLFRRGFPFVGSQVWRLCSLMLQIIQGHFQGGLKIPDISGWGIFCQLQLVPLWVLEKGIGV